ncbi:uncharacterized protein LOC112456237 [Temnothorax curvispinosus]|uniref:Uncharacterized protein LOC112456237 n=1 Tax=Temnothorax curvispinosus TaxID=300111 RepID=A0A6J1Q0B6_9HYME|nr:uncharacterized protein LOC112456237 [Temnothorax curvispinosus]
MREIHELSMLAVDNVAQRPNFLVRYPTVAGLVKDFEAAHLKIIQDASDEEFTAEDAIRFPTDSWDYLLLKFLLEKLPRLLREKFESEHRAEEIPKYAQLTKFLSDHCRVLASVSGPTNMSIKSQSSSAKKSASASSLATQTAKCPVCKEQHLVFKCLRFLKLSPREKHSTAKTANLCLNCLRAGHGINNCTSTGTCRSCQARHHTLLHFGRNSDPAGTPADTGAPSESAVNESSSPQNNEPLVTMTSVAKSSSTVLLSTVQAEALDVHGNPFPVRIFLDSASQLNFISENCMQKGGFGRTKGRTVVLAVNDTKAAATRGSTSLVIQVQGNGNTRVPIKATILPRISAQLPSSQVEQRAWKHIEELKLADPQYHRPGPIDILIGAEIFTSLLRDGRRIGKKGEPDAFNSIFGWVLVGSVSTQASRSTHSFLTFDSLDVSLSRFWQLDEIPTAPPYSQEDRRCEELFAQITRRDVSGRFVVSYPFIKNKPCFVGTRQVAVNRFRALERGFKSDKEFKINYSKFMQDYLNNGYMKLIKQPLPVDGPVFYLPHHGVFKSDSTTTKLRVVFDGSAKDLNGVSLNQMLRSGPKLQSDIVVILLMFRLGLVALTADVRQMFLQILVELAIACMLKLAAEGKTSYPLAAAALEESVYVDDVVASVESVEKARELQRQLQALLKTAGFELRKWAIRRIFDPLGFLTPLTFMAKRLIQQLWMLKVEWDDRPPSETCSKWERYKSELSALASIRIPRTITVVNNVVRQEIHGFCDASEQGYGAVVYIRLVTENGVIIRVLIAKSKVAPLKAITLPRLELSAAVLLSDLLEYVEKILRPKVAIDDTYACRILRGLFPQELVDHPLWWTGPAWLVEFEPTQETTLEAKDLPEEEENSRAFISTNPADDVDSITVVDSLLDRFSSLDKLVRVFAYCLRFVTKTRSNALTLVVDQIEFHSTLLYLVKFVQSRCFAEDISRLRRNQSCSKPLRKLAPFLDARGVLRVGGRLTHSAISYEAKHPALLPNRHQLTELIVERTHRVHLHPGHRALHYILSQNFWILGAHQAIKRCLSRCYRCFRANPRPMQPPMADLPLDRNRSCQPWRFIARRGRCSRIYSDCGTNFVGAQRELVGCMQAASEREQIQWAFNPLSAPHFGGLWETVVKSMKTHLKRVVGTQILTVEEFSTIVTQIEVILNSRPLCPTSSDPSGLGVLSPGHFLTRSLSWRFHTLT